MGMLPFLTGIDQQFFHRLFPIAIMGGMTSFFFIWMVLATGLFVPAAAVAAVATIPRSRAL
jgi:hypothetical protein